MPEKLLWNTSGCLQSRTIITYVVAFAYRVTDEAQDSHASSSTRNKIRSSVADNILIKQIFNIRQEPILALKSNEPTQTWQINN